MPDARVVTLVVSKRFVEFPCCKQQESIEHLFEELEKPESHASQVLVRSAGPWACDCGKTYKVQVYRDGSCELTDCNNNIGTKKDKWVLVTLAKSVKMVLHQEVRDPPRHQDKPDAIRFMVEENTCPIDIINDAVEVVSPGGDPDPHGAFRFEQLFDSKEDAMRAAGVADDRPFVFGEEDDATGGEA